MERAWPLIVADFRREYGLDPDGLAGLSVREFVWLLQGLSVDARFMRAWAATPKHVYRPEDIAAIKAAARR